MIWNTNTIFQCYLGYWTCPFQSRCGLPIIDRNNTLSLLMCLPSFRSRNSWAETSILDRSGGSLSFWTPAEEDSKSWSPRHPLARGRHLTRTSATVNSIVCHSLSRSIGHRQGSVLCSIVGQYSKHVSGHVAAAGGPIPLLPMYIHLRVVVYGSDQYIYNFIIIYMGSDQGDSSLLGHTPASIVSYSVDQCKKCPNHCRTHSQINVEHTARSLCLTMTAIVGCTDM